MAENTLPAFSSRPRLTCAAGYAIGVFFTASVGAGIVSEVVRSYDQIVFQGMRYPNDFTVLLVMLLIALAILVLCAHCWASFFRQKLVIDADGVLYQDAFRQVELKWDEVERLFCSNQYFHLVYASKRYRSAPAWLRVFSNARPIIDLRLFSNEKVIPGSPYGPIARAIQACAPHLLAQFPPGTEGDLQPADAESSLPAFVSPGILAGLISAAAGTAVFEFIDQFLIGSSILSCCLGFAFSCVPGMIGGKLLEVYLHSRLRKGKLTRKGAVTSGMALAALAGSSVCVLVIWLMFSIEPDMAGVNHVKMEFLEYFWKQAAYFRIEIALVLLITCICGGLAGSYIFNQFSRKPN